MYKRIVNIFAVRMEFPLNTSVVKGINIWSADDAEEEKLYQLLLKRFINDINDGYNHPKIFIPRKIQNILNPTEYIGLKVTKTLSDYENMLTEYLIEQSCNNHSMLAGITRYRIEFMVFSNISAQCFLSLRDQKNQADQLVCPAMSEVDHETLRILREIADKKNPNATITPTFSCRTERSDSVSSTE